MTASPNQSLNFEQLLQQFVNWLRRGQLTPKTVKNYASDVRRLLVWHRLTLGGNQLADLGAEILHRYLADLEQEQVPASTLARKLASLRKLEEFLRESLAWNPGWGLPANPGTHTKTELAWDKLLQRFQLALEQEGCKRVSVENYVLDIRLLLSFYAGETLEAIATKPKIAAYLAAERAKGLSAATLKRRLVSFRRFFAWAAREEYLAANPLESSLSRAARRAAEFVPLAFFQPRVTPGPVSSLLKPDEPSDRAGLFGLYDWYSRTRLSSYLHLSVLVIFCVMLALFGYRQFFSEASHNYAYPSAPVRPERVLSFQGRLTDSGGTPITTPINFIFRLYDAQTGGNELWDSSDTGACSLDPDQDGVFSVRLGDSTNGCGAEISEDVFSERANVWLEVQVSTETLSPRQPLATVPYALNSETVQGFPVSLQGGINTIPVINALGQIIIGANNPQIIASSGAFLIQGETLTFRTEPGSAGDINLAPDAGGTVNIFSGTTSQDSIFISNPNLTTGDLIRGEVGNNNTSYNFLSFAGGSTLDTKFQVDALGNTTIDGYLQAPGATLSATYTGATPLTIKAAGGTTTLTVNNAGQLALTTQGNTGGLVIGGDTNFYRAVANELKTDDSLVVVSDFSVNSLGTPGGVFYSTNTNGKFGVSAAGTTGQCLKSGGTGTPTWGGCDVAVGENFWSITGQVIHPTNTSLDLVIGGNSTASATFRAEAATGNVIAGGVLDINGAGTSDIAGTLNLSGGVLQRSGGNLTVQTVTSGNLIISSAGELYFSDTRTGNIPLSVADTALNANLTQGIIDSINDLYDLSGTTDAFWVQNNGALKTANNTVDVLFGGTSTAAAKFAFVNVNSGIPTASVSAGAAGATYLRADGTLATTNRQDLTLGTTGTTGDILLIPGTGHRVGVGTTNPASFFEVNGSFGSSALVRLVETGSNDILTALAGAVTRMTLSNAGQLSLPTQGATGGLLLGGDVNLYRTSANILRTDDNLEVGTLGIPGGVIYAQNASGLLGVTAAGSSGQCLKSGGSGTPTWDTCATGVTADSFWTVNGEVLHPINTALDVAVGGSTTASAKFQIFADSGTATSQGQLTFRGPLDPKINILNGEDFGIRTSVGGDAGLTERLTILNGGNVGIGDTTPLSLLTVGSGDLFQVNSSGNIVAIGGAAHSIANSSSDLVITAVDDLMFNDVRTGNIPLTIADTAINTNLAQAVIDAINDLYDLSTVGAAANLWVQTLGALRPANSTVDLLIGGTSTAAANFAVLNVNDDAPGIPTASVSADTDGAAYLTADGNLATTSRQNLTLGGATTGDIVFAPRGGTGTLYAQASTLNFNQAATINTSGVNTLTLAPGGNLQFFNSSNFITSAGNMTILGTHTFGGGHTAGNTSGNLTLTSTSQIVNINDNLYIGGLNIVDIDNTAFISLIPVNLSDVFPKKQVLVSGSLDVSDYINGQRGATLSAFVPSDKLLVLNGDNNGQTADYINVNTFGMTGGNVFKVTANGLVGINRTASPGAQLDVQTNTAATIGQIIQGSSGQTANLSEWRNSSGSTLSCVNATGQFQFGCTGGTVGGGQVNIDSNTGNAALIVNQNSLDQNIIAASASGVTRATINRLGDYQMHGPKTQTTYANLTDVFVYDTTADLDGGQWTNSDRARGSSWYNETLDHTFETCVPGTDDRCGSQYFPKRAVITADSSGVRIYDADWQKLWMTFNQGSTVLGADSNNNPKTVEMLNGRLYIGMDGSSATGLYIIDFREDAIYRYDTSGRWKFTLAVSGRNSAGSFINLNPVTALPSNVVNDVSPQHITGDNKVLPIDNTYITQGHYTPTNPADSSIARQDIADYSHDYVAVGTDGGARGSVSLIQPDLANMANLGISGAGIAAKHVVLLDDGSLYYTYRDQNSNANDKLKLLRQAHKKMSTNPTLGIINIASESASLIYGNKGSNNYGVAFRDGLDAGLGFNKGPAFPTSTMIINSLTITKATSTVDGRGNTIFIGDENNGIVVINEKVGDEVNGSVKYYTKDYITQEIPGDIRGSWAFNNNTASDLEDISVRTNDLTNFNSVTFSASGVRGNAASFTRASRQYLASSSATLLHSQGLNVQGEMALGAWVYVGDTSATSGKQVILSKSGDITRLGYKLYLDGGVPVLSVSEDGSGFTTASASTRLAANTWTHILGNVIPYKEIQIYIDGQIATKSAGAAISPEQVLSPFRIGTDAQSKHDTTAQDLNSDGVAESNTIGTVQSTTTQYLVPDASAFSPGDYVSVYNYSTNTSTQTAVTYVDSVNDFVNVLASPASTAAGNTVLVAKVNFQVPSTGYFTSTTTLDGMDQVEFSIGDLVQIYNVTDGTVNQAAVSAITESSVTFSAAVPGAAAGERAYASKLNATLPMHGITQDAVDTLTLPNAGGFWQVGDSVHVFDRIGTLESSWVAVDATTATTVDVTEDVISTTLTTDDFTLEKINKYAPVLGTATSATVISGPNNTNFAIGDYVQLTKPSTSVQTRSVVTNVSASNITVSAGVSGQAAADTIYVSKLNNETVGEEFFGGRIDDAFVAVTNLSQEQIKKMYLRGAAALQSHVASRVTGITGADSYQQLHGAGASAATVNRVTALDFDVAANLLYVGTNDSSANTGGISVIGYDTDSLIDLYDDTNNTTKKDDTGSQFDATDAVAISVRGSAIKNLAIAGSNDTTTKLWLEKADVSLQGFMNTNHNPHGETLSQTSLRVEDTLFLGKSGGQQNFFETSGNFTKFYGNLQISGDTIINGQILSDERQTSAVPLLSAGSELTVSDRAMVLGDDGFARIGILENQESVVKYIRCLDVTCNQYAHNVIDDGGENNNAVGTWVNIAMGPDKLVRFLYGDLTRSRTIFVRCLDDLCQKRTKTVISGEAAAVINYLSMAIRSDGTAVIVGPDAGNFLGYWDCKNLDCSFSNSNVLDTATSVQWTNVALDSQDRARISYHESTGLDLEYVACEDRACRTFSQTTVDSAGTTGTYSTIEIGTDDFARVAAYDTTSTDIIFVRCQDIACTSRTSVNVDVSANNVGTAVSMDLRSDNLPVLSYRDVTNLSLKVTECDDQDCVAAGNTVTTVDNPANSVADTTTIAIDSNNQLRIMYSDVTLLAQKYAVCTSTCASSQTRHFYGHLTVVEAATARWMDQELGFDNLSRIVFWESTNFDLYYLRCLDVDCSAFILKLVEETNDIGRELSIAIGPDGFAYITHFDNTNGALRFVKCNDDNCSNPYTAQIYTTIGNNAGTDVTYIGRSTRIRIGRDGLPRIAALNSGDGMTFTRCLDPFCHSHNSSNIGLTGSSTNGSAYADMILDPNDFGAMVWTRNSDNGTTDTTSMIYAHCTGMDCTETDGLVTIISTTGVVSDGTINRLFNPRLNINPQTGLPMITDLTNVNQSAIYMCSNWEACATFETAINLAASVPTNNYGAEVDKNTGTLLIGASGTTNIHLIRCADYLCSSFSSTAPGYAVNRTTLSTPYHGMMKLRYFGSRTEAVFAVTINPESLYYLVVSGTNYNIGATDRPFSAVYANKLFGRNVTTEGLDLAEEYPTSEDGIGPAEVVSFDPNRSERVRRSRRSGDPLLAGVVSTSPGLLLQGTQTSEPRVQLALSGRVPVRIATDSAEIKIGDWLTSSSHPGLAMKATSPGYMVGRALKEWRCEDQLVPVTDAYGRNVASESGELVTQMKRVCPDTTMVFVELAQANPDIQISDGQITISKELAAIEATQSAQIADVASTYVLRDGAGNIINQIAMFGKGFFGQVTAGLIKTQELVAGSARIETSLLTPQLETDVIRPTASGSGDLKIDLRREAQSSGSGDLLGTLLLDGNASVSGTLYANNLSAYSARLVQLESAQADVLLLTANDATVAGTLRAGRLEGEISSQQITDLEDRVSGIISRQRAQNVSASESGLLAGSNNLQRMLDLLNGSPIATASDPWGTVASSPATSDITLADLAQIDQDVQINGLLAVDNLAVADTFALGTTLLTANSLAFQTTGACDGLNPLCDTFALQPSGVGTVSILASTMVIAPDGVNISVDLSVDGNLHVGQSLFADLIRPNQNENLEVQLASADRLGELVIRGQDNQEVAAFSASGSARLRKLVIAAENAAADGTTGTSIITNATAGTAALPANTQTFVVRNSQVRDGSLLYLTPTSSTENHVLYIQSKTTENPDTPESEGQFVVSIDTPIGSDIQFNWWIIN